MLALLLELAGLVLQTLTLLRVSSAFRGLFQILSLSTHLLDTTGLTCSAHDHSLGDEEERATSEKQAPPPPASRTVTHRYLPSSKNPH
jgi:hypothetical protein